MASAVVREGAAIHWFRKGLRLHDNPALVEACKRSTKVYPLFILDPKFCQGQMSVNRHRFLLQSLEDLDRSLRGIGTRLFVVHGQPEIQLPELVKKWDVNLLTYEKDIGPYSVERDQKVIELLSSIEISGHETHTLFELERYLAKSKKGPPKSYQSFCDIFKSCGNVRMPLPAPTLEDMPTSAGKTEEKEDQYNVPSLTDIGYSADDIPTSSEMFPGGETEALRRLKEKVHDQPKWVAAYEKPNTSPNALEPTTTTLGPYLTMGCLSSAAFYHEVKAINDRSPGHSQPPMSLHGQLLWREFFYLCAATTPNHGKMIDNPQCKQIPWRRDEDVIATWKEGRTGYPFIDACMMQLRHDGWIHHLARHAVACFLTRGDLWQHWEDGAKHFEWALLDGDWAINNANWQWLSCSRFFYQYGRCYSPIAFGKKTDPDGLYIKKWLPQLAKMPKKYIFEPWKAPPDVQRAAGCIIGKDYPAPIVEDHTERSKENMGKLAAAYKIQKEGGEIVMPEPQAVALSPKIESSSVEAEREKASASDFFMPAKKKTKKE